MGNTRQKKREVNSVQIGRSTKRRKGILFGGEVMFPEFAMRGASIVQAAHAPSHLPPKRAPLRNLDANQQQVNACFGSCGLPSTTPCAREPHRGFPGRHRQMSKFTEAVARAAGGGVSAVRSAAAQTSR